MSADSPRGNRNTIPEVHPYGLAGQVYDRLVEMILSEELSAGQSLRVHSLSKMLGVSATPVREALIRANATGIVSRVNNRGFKVSDRPNAQDLDDLFEARIALEARTAYRAAQCCDDKLIQQLEGTWDLQVKYGEMGGFDGFTGFLDQDREFHNFIAIASQNCFLYSSLESLGSHVLRFRSFDEKVVTDQQETLNEHRVIIEALRLKNPLAAQAAMTMHLANLRARVGDERRRLEEPDRD